MNQISLIWEALVERGHPLLVAGVAVVRRAAEPAGGRRLQQQGGVLRLRVFPGRGVGDVVGMLGPVVVVTHDLGVQAGGGQRRTEPADHLDGLPGGQVGAGVARGGAVLRLVLDGEPPDRNPGRLVSLHELDQVVGVRLVDPGVVDQPAAHERVVGLHPGRRAPRRPHHLEVGVEGQGLPEQRQDLGLVVVDREVVERVVGLAGRHVVEGVVRAVDEVGGTNRLPQERQPVGDEQVTHRRVPGSRVELREHRRRRVGDRRPESIHRLVAQARIDRDRQPVAASALREGDRPAVIHPLHPVRCGHPDVGAGRRLRRRCMSRWAGHHDRGGDRSGQGAHQPGDR